jgi:aquaporin Z
MTGNRYWTEAVGTFALVFAGCGAIVVNDGFPGTLGHLGVCIVFGLIVMAVIYAFGNVSGAHINPAVTIAFVVAHRFEARLALPYIASQLAGAVAAAMLLRVLFGAHPTLGATLPSGSLLQSFVLEVVLSFLLMLVILNVSTGHMEKGIMAGVAIGGTVALEALVGGPVSGASMNPARSFGPAIASGELADLWIYFAAPIIGMALACPMCRIVQGPDCCARGFKNESAP